jgi:t-SNARE complex subunit (syntaxin)
MQEGMKEGRKEVREGRRVCYDNCNVLIVVVIVVVVLRFWI